MTDNGTRRLTPWFLFGQALGTFRARWKRVLGVGAVVTAFTVTAGTLLDLMFENKEAQNDGKIALGFALASVALSAANGFGTTFLSGVLDRTVGEHQHGHDAESLWQLLRRIPYGPLIIADILALFLKIFGFVLLIIPGFIAITLLSVVGPVVMIEGTGPVAALRRSAQLVRPFFWLTFVAVTIPIIFENLLGDCARQGGVVPRLPPPSRRRCGDRCTRGHLRVTGRGDVGVPPPRA